MSNSQMRQAGFGVVGIVAVVLVVAALAGVSVVVFKKSSGTKTAVSAPSPTPQSDEPEATPMPADEKRLSADWLVRESVAASIRVPDGFNILVADNHPINFSLPDDQGELTYRKGAKAQVVGEPHKHFGLGLLVSYDGTGLNDLGTYQRSFKTYSDLKVDVDLFEQNDPEAVTTIPYGSKYLKYKVIKDNKRFTVDYFYKGEGVVDIIDEMVRTIIIK